MKRLALLFLFSIIYIFHLESSNKIVLYNPASSARVPIEITYEIFQHLPMPRLLLCGLTSKKFYEISRNIVEKRWNWDEQIPKIFYEQSCLWFFQQGLEKGEKKAAEVLERRQLPDFIKSIAPNHFKDSIPYFCFHDLFKSNFNSKQHFNIIFEEISSWEYKLEWTTNFLGISSKNELKVQYNYYIDEENGVKVIDDDAESINKNFYITDSNPDKGIILILTIFDPNNWEIVLKKLLEEDIVRKIYILQINQEIDDHIFPVLSPLLKQLGEKIILSVAPTTRSLCIRDDIKIVLPQKYYHKQAKYKELIKELFNSKKYNNMSAWSRQNFFNISASFKKFYEIKPWVQLTSILDMDFSQVKTTLFPIFFNYIHDEYQELFNMYGTRKFKLPSLYKFIELLSGKNISKYLGFLDDIEKYVEKKSKKSACDKILVPATLFLLENDKHHGAIKTMKKIESPDILKSILPAVLNTFNQAPKNAFFYSYFCIHLYESALEISDQIDLNGLLKFQTCLIDSMPRWRKKLFKQPLARRFENTFLAIMSKYPKTIKFINHEKISYIFNYLRNSGLIISPEKSLIWLRLIDEIAQRNTLFSDKDFILKYIPSKLKLPNSLEVLQSENYSKELKTIFYFSICKKREGCLISDDLFESIITKTGIFSIDLLADWISYFVQKKGNEKYNVEIIKMLINTAKNIKEIIQKDESYKSYNGLFLSYINAYCNSNLAENLSLEELTFIEEMAYIPNTYFKNIKLILQQNNEDKKIYCLQKYYNTHKHNGIYLRIKDATHFFKTANIQNKNNESILKNILIKSLFFDNPALEWNDVIEIANDSLSKNPNLLLFCEDLMDALLNEHSTHKFKKKSSKTIEIILTLNNEKQKIYYLSNYYEIHKDYIFLGLKEIISFFKKANIKDKNNKSILIHMLAMSYLNTVNHSNKEEIMASIQHIANYRKEACIVPYEKLLLQNLSYTLLTQYLNIMIQEKGSLRKNMSTSQKDAITFIDLIEDVLRYIPKTKKRNQIVINKILEFYKKDGLDNGLLGLTLIISCINNTSSSFLRGQIAEGLSKYCINLLEKTYDNFKVYKAMQHLASIQDQKKHPNTLELLTQCLKKYCAGQDYWLRNSVYIINPYVIGLVKTFEENKDHMEIIKETIEKISTKDYVKSFIEQTPNLKQSALSVCKNLCKIGEKHPVFKTLAKAFCQELTGIQNIVSLYNFTNDREIENICKKKLAKISIFPLSILIILSYYYVNQKYHFLSKMKISMLPSLIFPDV